MPKIIVSAQSIKNELKSYKDKPAEAILQYIWNGFDAEANNIHIKYSFLNEKDAFAFGYPNLEIYDDGIGWDLTNIDTVNLFLVSPKQYLNYKSLPQGREGVGRFTFYSFAKNAEWETVFNKEKFKLTIKNNSLDKFNIEKDSNIRISKGTRVIFNVFSEKMTQDFFKKELVDAIKLEFCWLLRLFPQKNIYINKKPIDINDLIEKQKDKLKEINGYKFNLRLIQWKIKPTREFSKYYFLNEEGRENFKKTTGLNYKLDDFYHSAYIKSNFFNNFIYKGETGDTEQTTQEKIFKEEKKEKEKQKILHILYKKIKKELEAMRKPHLRNVSKNKIIEWKRADILPSVKNLGIKQENYDDLIKEIYTVVPRLFTDSNNEQRKLILRFFSSMLSTEDKNFILQILDEVYKLSPQDKNNLNELLEKTTLSNIIRTTKEIAFRLKIIASLEEILLSADNKKYTKEVVHLQKILDENFWIFGEGYRLFASTEGSIRKTLIRYKDEILRKTKQKINTSSRKELDLFLTKSEVTDNRRSEIVIEIKRPAITLGKNELDQIKEYMRIISKEDSCNGENFEWTFYLIGNNFNDYIETEIENLSNRGERKKGLAFCNDKKNQKLYIQKWSDIILQDQKSKYKFLQDKLNLKIENLEEKKVEDIVNDTIKK